MDKTIWIMILSFLIYSVAGWIWESLVCPILTNNPIHNSGFLTGPVVPIYGAGAVTVNILFSQNDSLLSIFLEGACVACVIEYLTSYVMEKIYHRRWWDYSNKRFNVNGRICAEGFVVFGLFSVVSIKYLDPRMAAWLATYDLIPLVVVATIGMTLFVTDLIMTINQMAHLQEKLDLFTADLVKEADKLKVTLEENRMTRKAIYNIIEQRRIQNIPPSIEKNFSEARLLKAFPHLLNKK